MNVPSPVILEGRHVRLEPLGDDHAEGLLAAGGDPEIFAHMLANAFAGIDEARESIRQALETAAKGIELPFAIVPRDTGRAAGSTSYLDISLAHETLEIGRTWLARSLWRTAVNTECKYLLLGHAFETLGCRRVTLKTDVLNLRSQRAIERLGARREGVLRRHMKVKHGRQRDSVIYGITDLDWPEVRERLEAFLSYER